MLGNSSQVLTLSRPYSLNSADCQNGDGRLCLCQLTAQQLHI